MDKPKYYHIPEDDWKNASTLPEVIVKLVRMKQTKSDEFQMILRIWGEQNVRRMYKEQLEREKK